MGSTGVNRRWRALVRTACRSVGGTNIGANNCDANGDGIYDEQCAKDTFCHVNNNHNGGCGTSGVCTYVKPATNQVDRTAPITITNEVDLGVNGVVADFATPSGPASSNVLATPGMMTACFATQESLAGYPQDSTDFVSLTTSMEVITTPRLGPTASPGNVYMVAGSSPSFNVNSMKAQDIYYFMPYRQQQAAADADCVPALCTAVGGSNVAVGQAGATDRCDSDFDGQFDDTCTSMAKCDPTKPYNGGCGTAGTCQQIVPTVHTSMYTGIILGGEISSVGGVNTGTVTLPASPHTPLSVPAVPDAIGGLPSAWKMIACLIPAGAKKDQPTNVKRITDELIVIKEPTDKLITEWFRGSVYELRFNQPQIGSFDNGDLHTGHPGDIIVLQQNGCSGVHLISPASFMVVQKFSAKMTLQDYGGEILGDERGGTAREGPLATGKVNELPAGTYTVCYATKASMSVARTLRRQRTCPSFPAWKLSSETATVVATTGRSLLKQSPNFYLISFSVFFFGCAGACVRAQLALS